MEFIIENIWLLILAAGGVAQWLKATQDAKKERENPTEIEEYDPEELEEFIEEAEMRHAPPAVPPPLPPGHEGSMPGAGRSPVPSLRKKSSATEPVITATGLDDELARQAAIAEQLSGLKRAKQARVARPAKGEPKKREPSVATGSLRSRLGNRRELRQAFVLKEILEKPVGLR